ncbi:DUF4910 domain-containing protein [Aquimarina sp. 2201CG14-23]|uniref:DUF4910 domain-containing protein n=1 Tax=Aquimarina mycalae TaxID=3040073 RepID=UPI0024782D2F|nr:DUF4910 domain-containing protein [Aquimarina sp. 2201CG14-23]MDH7444578.1 DUF4910 domain-containing protein [Aquimarina sp. 2201CG14-23]
MEITKINVLGITLLLISFISISQEKPKNPFGSISSKTGLIITDDATRMLIHNSSGDRAHTYVQQISTWDRQQNTKDISTATEWVAKKAKEFGLQNVVIEKFVADGKTEYFGKSSDPFWIAKKGELWAKTPYEFKITSYADLPMSLATNSYSTKATAELIDIGAGISDIDYQDKELKGNIVLTSSNPYRVIRKAIWEKGAIGIISYYSIPYWDKPNRLEGDFPDQVGWSGMPMNEEKEKQSFAFMISQRKAKELQEVLRTNKKVTLFADIETEHRNGELNVLSGVIPGSKYPNEEIVVTAHIDHYKPGANDNASGSSVSLEMVRTLQYLINTNQIERPLRTIRFLWLPEFTGTEAWFSRHTKDGKKRILNLNMDMLGADLTKTNSSFDISLTPDWNASFINAFSMSLVDFLNTYNNSRYPKRKDFHIISVNGTRNHVNVHNKPYTRGSDHQIFNDFGIPGIAFGTWPDNFYHSSEDTPDKVDPTQLHRVTFSGLASILMTAYTDSPQLQSIVDLVELYGLKRLQYDEFKAKKDILLADKSTIIDNAYFAEKTVKSGYERERNALKSCLIFSQGIDDKNIIQQKIALYNEKEKLTIAQLKLSTKKKANSFGLTSVKRKVLPKEKDASLLIPQRLVGKELVTYYAALSSIKDPKSINYKEIQQGINSILSELREREVGELRIYDFQNTIVSYTNGKRSLVDIRDAMYAEYGIEIPISIIQDLFEVFIQGGAIHYK